MGVTRQSIHGLVKRGILTPDSDGLIDANEAAAAITTNLRADSKAVAAVMADTVAETRQPSQAPEDGAEPMDATSYHVARTLREAAEARIAHLRLQKMAGSLVEADKVRRVVTTWAATARGAFERIPDKLAERLAAESAPEQCHALLSAEIDMVLADLAAGAETMVLEDDADGRA